MLQLLGSAEAVGLGAGDEWNPWTLGPKPPGGHRALPREWSFQMCLVSQDAQPGQPRRAGKGSEVVPSLCSASEPRSDQTASAFQDLMAPSTQGQADTAPRNALGTGNVSTLKIKQQTTPRRRVGRCWFANFPEDMLMESCPLPSQGRALPGLSGISSLDGSPPEPFCS